MSGFGPLITAAKLHHALRDESCRAVDCRFDLQDPAAGRRAWLSAHIPGAVYADLDKDLAGPVTDVSGRHPLPAVSAAALTFGRLGIRNDCPVVVYDGGSGAIAARAWWMLRWLGHRRVALLDGGLAGWIAEGRPVEQGDVQVPPATFCASPAPGWRTTTAAIEQHVREGGGYCLVDGREAARFAGEKEPIDPVAGHIPGAVNLPFGRSLGEDGRWRTPQALRETWNELGVARRTGDWSVMCGSGVTACHLVLSAELAGLARPRLYAGSWSEWIRDPDRPIATGA